MPRRLFHGSEERFRLENAVRLGARVDEKRLARLPETDIAASPLLRKALCEYWLEQGQLLRARDGLTSLMPELAVSLLRGPLVSAMALLCMAQVRVGELDEARSLVRFLLEERERFEEEADGDVVWALARCVGLSEKTGGRFAGVLTGDGGAKLRNLPMSMEQENIYMEACRLYDEAIAAYDRAGRADKALEADIERMAAYAGLLPDPVWERYAVGLEQRLKRQANGGGAALSYLRALRAFAGGDAHLAAAELGLCAAEADRATDGEADEAMPAGIKGRSRVLRVAVAARLREEARLEAALEALAVDPPDGSIEVETRFEWACARCECDLARGDAAAARSAYRKAQTLAGLGLIPGAERRLEQLARLLEDRESESSGDGVTLRQLPDGMRAVQPEAAAGAAQVAGAAEATEAADTAEATRRPETAAVQGAQSSAALPLVRGKEAPWRVLLFGRIQFERAGQTVRDIRWKRTKAKELLLYLLLQPEYAAPRERVVEALFPDGEPEKADNRFYVTAHQLKRVLREHLGAEAGVVLRENSIRLQDGLIDYVDAEQYEALVRTGDQLWATDRAYAETMYRRAEPLYDTLAPDTPYADWLEELREQLLARQCELLARLGASALEAGDDGRAEAYARERLRLQPLQEEAYQALLAALLRQGRAAEAESLFRGMEQLLAEQLGAMPLADTLRLMGR